MQRSVQEAPAAAGNLRPPPAALPAALTFFSSAPCTSRASNMLPLLQTAAPCCDQLRARQSRVWVLPKNERGL